MNHMRFEEPITLLVGFGFPARIEGVMEAYALLQDWPPFARNASHEVAFNACKAGITGAVDPETVRAALESFAQRNDILIADPSLQAASSVGSRHHRADHLAGQ